MTSAAAPAEAFPPGEYLRDELEARGWTLDEFAGLIGWPLHELTDILDAEAEITPEAACALSEVLGTTPELWMNLQTAYHRYEARASSHSGH